MKLRHTFLMVALLAAAAGPAQAACKEKRSRDVSFVELAVPEGAIRPAGAQDFTFVTDDTTYDQLVAKVGPPDAAKGSGVSYYIWCFADGTELTVATPDRVAINDIRHEGKLLYKRGKKKKMLTPMTFSLIHATDFADRTEHHIIPPLKAGAVVLADRYVYTAFARDVVRGVSPKWVRDLYAFAVKPTIAFYFRTPLDVSMKRILGGRDAIKYYEAGMDLGLSDDLEQSFKLFQGHVIEEYEKMVDEFGLVVIDATRSIEEQQAEVRQIVGDALAGTKKTKVRRWLDLTSLAKGSRI